MRRTPDGKPKRLARPGEERCEDCGWFVTRMRGRLPSVQDVGVVRARQARGGCGDAESGDLLPCRADDYAGDCEVRP